jgi:hypothetical protein
MAILVEFLLFQINHLVFKDNSETTLFLTQDILEIDAGKQLIATKTLLVKEECAWLLINRHHVVLLLAVKLDSIAELPEPVFV